MLVRSPPAALARDGGQCTGSWDDGAGATGTLRTRRTSELTVISVADQSGPSRVLCPDSTCRKDGAHLLEVEQVLDRKSVVQGKSVSVRVDPGGSRTIIITNDQSLHNILHVSSLNPNPI